MEKMVPIDRLAGFVLAGGASRRMGRSKARLVLGREMMVERQIRLLRRVASFVAVLGAPEDFADLEVPVIPDEIPGRGPLGGIYTGLLHSRREFNVFLSCDLPFMDARFLAYLARRAFTSEADITIPRTLGYGFQSLVAVYRRRSLWAIRTSLERGENKVRRLFSRVRCQILDWAEIHQKGFSARIFNNMNTPEDYFRAQLAISFQPSAFSTVTADGLPLTALTSES